MVRLIMALERTNPLPEGRYSVTLLGNLQIERFDEWLRRHRDFVSVRGSELDQSAKPVTAFIVFDVDFPDVVRWEGPGFPSIVPGNAIPSRSETEQSPQVAEPAEQLSDFLAPIRPALPVVLLLVVAYLWNKE